MKTILFSLLILIVSCSVTIPPTYIYYTGSKPQRLIDSIAVVHKIKIPEYIKWVTTSYYGVHNHDSVMIKNYIYNIKTVEKRFIIINVIEPKNDTDKTLNIRIE